jgi:glycosyltransferase involved in cell wall biosynthesis
MKNPKVTILMPVYNGEKYLKEAIDSIISQTFSDFEFLIIDDGSTDSSLELIKSYDDQRIRLYVNDGNKGVVAALNRGIDLAKGKYIARMDCDDISMPGRLEKQVYFLDKNLKVGVCGTSAVFIDENGKELGAYDKESGDSLALEIWKPSPIIHPSAMIRVSSLGQLRYKEEFIHAEDYGLWSEMSGFCKLDNLPERLLSYRVHGGNITKKHRVRQLESSYAVFAKYFFSNISFDSFLALILEKFKINPITRIRLQVKMFSGKRNIASYLVRDNAEYAFLWIKNFFKKHE